MDQTIREFIKEKYLEYCNSNYPDDQKRSAAIIQWFFNRLDNFDIYMNYLNKNNGRYNIPEFIKRPKLYYACTNSGLDYSEIKQWIESYQAKNNCIVVDYDL